MRVLIIEDNERKLNDTIEYIQKACKEELEMDHAMSVRAAKQYIKEVKYDRVVIDMQLPDTNNSSINRFGGIAILQYLDATQLNTNTKRVVNSSSDETRGVLDTQGYQNETLIVNSSMYNCSRQFDVFINGEVSLTSSITAESVAQTQMDIAAGCATALVMGLPVVESIFDNHDHTHDRVMEEQARPFINYDDASSIYNNITIDPVPLTDKQQQESNPNDYVTSDDNE